MKFKVLGALSAALLLAGCGGSDNGGGSITGRDHNRMVEACLSQTNNERPMCECVADMGRDELTPASFHFVLASLEDNHVEAARLRNQMSTTEAVQAGGFVVNAFARCARSMSGG